MSDWHDWQQGDKPKPDDQVIVQHINGVTVGPTRADTFQWYERSDDDRSDEQKGWDIKRWKIFVLPNPLPKNDLAALIANL